LEPGGLPDRCVVCGADSCSPVKRQFRVSIRESDYAVVRVQELRVMEGWVPLCPRHRNHFLSPLYAALTGCGTFAAGVALTLLVGFWTPVRTALALGIFAVGVAAGVTLAVRIKNGAVQESDVTDEGVRLKNLSPAFVEAVQAAREKLTRDR
jgi:hypothetical protein